MRQMAPEDPRNARTVQPSPCRISSASGPANQWTPLSSRPCLPLCRRRCKWQGPFAPRTLLRFIASPDPSATLSSSADFPGLPVIRPTLLRRFLAGTRRGFSSCSACPCHRAVASTPPRRTAVSVSFRLVILPSPYGCRLGPRGYSFSRPQCVHCCYGPVARNPPSGGLVARLRRFCFHLLRYPNYGALTSTPAGLFPAEHASLHWTHSRSSPSRASPMRPRCHRLPPVAECRFITR